jgi:putative Holliday junction resolvase
VGRIVCIDYGKKRCGIAVTDPLRIIASGLTTVDTDSLIWYLKTYMKSEPVDLVLVGYPLALDGSPTDATAAVEKFIRNFKKVFPELALETIEEQYSSVLAARAMHEMGMKKKDKERKGAIDEMAATMLLQEYLSH